jgi:hypothetical protein
MMRILGANGIVVLGDLAIGLNLEHPLLLLNFEETPIAGFDGTATSRAAPTAGPCPNAIALPTVQPTFVAKIGGVVFVFVFFFIPVFIPVVSAISIAIGESCLEGTFGIFSSSHQPHPSIGSIGVVPARYQVFLSMA